MATSYYTPLDDEAAVSQHGSSILGSDDTASTVFDDGVSMVSSATSVSQAHQQQQEMIQEQLLFADHRNRLLSSIDRTRHVLEELRTFNKDSWVVHYPHFESPKQTPKEETAPTLRRAESALALHAPEHSDVESDVESSNAARPAPQRSFSVSSPPTPVKSSTTSEHRLLNPETAKEFSILKLDLKLGAISPAQLVHSLEKNSIAQLLDGKIAQSIQHLDSLEQRISDTSSKVLVTGDLNAGKSTFVNGLLHRQVLPVDQQPCTTLFCEVLDANDNESIQEVHAIKDAKKYNREDDSTFDRYDLNRLDDIVTESDRYSLLKIYVYDRRDVDESLLSNGIVDIALIDAPGLNRDSLKTTALFARQEEIDVVVFVVSAENHFTLSAKEFLWNASHEKAYIFIVVNRFDQIKNKDRCRRGILEQVEQLSPETYKHASELVHFVNSSAMFEEDGTASKDGTAEFSRLEKDLRSFVLDKRSQSKLAPAQNYLKNTLTDVILLSSSNADVAKAENERVTAELEKIKPALERSQKLRDQTLEEIESTSEEVSDTVRRMSRKRLEMAMSNLEDNTAIAYPGIINAWKYAEDVRNAMVSMLHQEIKSCESVSRTEATRGVEAISGLGLTHLSDYQPKLFRADVMYKRKAVTAEMLSQILIAIEPTDFVDLDFSSTKDMSVVSLSMGACTLVGARFFGLRDALTTVVRATQAIGTQNMRKWAAPVLVLTSLGVLAYLATDVPNAVPRKIARRLRTALEEGDFTDREIERITKEARKVMRMAGWDLQNAFEKSVEEQKTKKEEHLAMQQKTSEANKYFTGLTAKAEELRTNVSKYDLSKRL